MKVLQVCAYAAPYEGNFMQSLFALEKRLLSESVETVYAFPQNAKNHKWVQQLEKRADVYYLPLYRSQINPKVYKKLRTIFRENPEINIVHSHFEQYDIPVAITTPRNIKVYWHLHDPVVVENNLRGLLMRFQYGIIGNRARLISVCEKYRQDMVRIGFPEKQSITVINGICLDRVVSTKQKKEVDFVTFGWDYFRKGDDVILSACERLQNEGYKFRLVLNGLEPTWAKLEERYNGNDPDFLIRGEPVENIDQLFEKCKCYIQASRRETFSYAVCEAAYAGLDVISSDIPGTVWAHELPTVAFFENEDVDGLYQLMKQCLEGQCASMTDIDKSRRIIEESYSVDAWVEKIVNCYRSM